MNEFSYESIGGHTYLVYEIKQTDNVDSLSLGMLVNNSIPGVAKTTFNQMDNACYIKYDISAKISAESLSSAVDKKTMLGLFSGIVGSLLAAEEYMLEPSLFLLDPSFIFVNVHSSETLIIGLPINDDGRQVDLRSFFRHLLFNVRFKNPTDNFIGQIINYLNSTTPFSLLDFSNLLSSINSTSEYQSNVKREISDKAKSTPKTVELDAFKNKYSASIRSEPVPPLQPKADQFGISPAKGLNAPGFSQPVAQASMQQSSEQIKGHTEKSISLFYLLQHYNKENAALYKDQKERRAQQKRKNRQTGSKAGNKEAKPALNVGYEFPRDAPSSLSSAQINGKDTDVDVIREDIPAATGKGHFEPPKLIDTPGDFGNTVFLETEDDTTKFDDRESQPYAITPTLIRKRNNERIRIDSPIFRIGRDSSFNNYAVSDNRYVGHTHCHIVNRDGEFFLVDDNSKNHTFLDGQQIPPSTEVKLSHGQKFRLSDEEFEFLLY